MSSVGTGLLWATALSTGIMAGIYFAFSTFVMQSLAALPRSQGIAAMNSINDVILSSAFMPLFFGTTLASVVLGIWGGVRWGDPGSWAMLAGAIVYVIGMFVFTAAFNVPLNEALAKVDPHGAEAAPTWSHYLTRWTAWNHARTAASAIACALYVVALNAR